MKQIPRKIPTSTQPSFVAASWSRDKTIIVVIADMISIATAMYLLIVA
ncbi:hypothetical protein KBC40_01625 [Patescibacteria group bacterium]|nr:hypothetical protein [Patescibacteria group bacterium]